MGHSWPCYLVLSRCSCLYHVSTVTVLHCNWHSLHFYTQKPHIPLRFWPSTGTTTFTHTDTCLPASGSRLDLICTEPSQAIFEQSTASSRVTQHPSHCLDAALSCLQAEHRRLLWEKSQMVKTNRENSDAEDNDMHGTQTSRKKVDRHHRRLEV